MDYKNGVMMQYFHWYTPNDGSLWKELAQNVEDLAKAGITALWLPPATKGAAGMDDVGYGIYDLYDLGEFDQKGAKPTKYGTKDEFLAAIAAAKKVNMQVYADIVFNQKMGADHAEEFNATPHSKENSKDAIGEMQPIKAWTHFSFPGRNHVYSPFEWHWYHFTSVDFNEFDPESNAVYLFEGKYFDQSLDSGADNYDYLMGCDLDFNNDEVRTELYRWGKWFIENTGVDGFRFDALKHVKTGFFMDWCKEMSRLFERDFFAVGEFWANDTAEQKKYLHDTDSTVSLFDSVLQGNFSKASKEEGLYDLRKIFDDTLVQTNPTGAVTLVSNHDTQPLQTLESVVEAWFKPIAYALILLRRDGYPCVFVADYYGAEYKGYDDDGNDFDIILISHKWLIDKFLEARKRYAFGDQYDYFDYPNCIGWTRLGDEENPGGMAVLMSNDEGGFKTMQAQPNTTYFDLTEHIPETVTTNEEGWGEFHCQGKSVSVWVPMES